MNQFKKMFLVMVIIILATSISCSQSATESDKEKIDSLISRMMTLNRENKEKTERITLTDERLKKEPPEKLLSLLKPYENDDSFLVKQTTLYYEVKIANLHPTPKIRQQVTGNLIRHMLDPNSEIRGDSYRKLIEFTEKDFSNESKMLIKQRLTEKKKVTSKREVLICGIANIREALPLLKEMLIDETAYMADPNQHINWYYTVGWRARLAQARMGVKEDIDRCVSLIEKEINPYNDVQLLDDLGYIRQPEAIESLKKYFLSDLRLLPTNPGMKGEPYAQYLMPILDDNLSNFPVKKGETQKLGRIYSEEEIDLCRKWMSDQIHWEIVR